MRALTCIAKPAWGLLAALSLAWLSACSTPPSGPPVLSERILLLPKQDGSSSGAVSIERTGSGQVVELTRAFEQTELFDKGNSGGLTDPWVIPELPEKYRRVVQSLPPMPSHYVLYYPPGTASLDDQAKEVLASVLRDIQERPLAKVQVVGYTDTVGSDEVNLKVSLQRAKSVEEFLIRGGVSADIITSIGRGKNLLAVPTPDNTPEPKNRRVEISVR